MKAFFSTSILAALVGAQGLVYAQTPNETPNKPVARTSYEDYLKMDDAVKPKFIYYSVALLSGSLLSG